MNSCQISYDTLEKTLLSAYKSNFEKYKNLTSVIEDVLSLPDSVPDEAKVHAVWYYAGYVHTLANSVLELQTKDWDEGRYISLHDYLSPFLTGEQTFNYGDLLKEISTYFSRPLQIEKNKTLEETIIDSIADLSDADESSIGHLVDEIVNSVLSNLSVLDPVSLDPNYSSAVSLLNMTVFALVNRSGTSANITEINRINTIIDSLVNANNTSKDYISLRDADGIGMYKGHEMYILRKPTGDLFEVYYDRPVGKYYYYSPGEQLHEQEVEYKEGVDQITLVYDKNNDHVVNPQTLQLRLHTDELFTGLVIPETYAVNDSQSLQEKLANQAQKGSTFYSSIKIIASTKPQELNAKRQARILEKFGAIGRTLETEERPNQDASLKGNNGVVLTFYKPTTGFTVTISSAQNNISFDLDSYSNLAFLRSDNTVEPVDYDNPEHIELLKSLIQVDSPNFREERYEDITEQQIQKLKEADRRHKAFQAEVQQRMDEEGFSFIDDIFFKYYDLNNITTRTDYKLAAKSQKTLKDFILSNNGELNAKIQNYNEDTNEPEGEPVLSKVAIIMKKDKGVWVIENSIDKNQKIVAPNGKEYSSVEVYLEEEVVLSDSNGGPVNLKAWATERFPQNNAIYVSLKPEADKLIPIAVPVVYQKQVTSSTDFFNFASSLIFSMKKAKMEKGNTALLDFRQKGWGFDVSRTSGIVPQIVIHSQEGTKKVLGISFTMIPNPNNTEESRNAFNNFSNKYLKIEFNRDILNKMNRALNKVYEEAGVDINDDLSLEEVMNLSEKAARKLEGVGSVALIELRDVYQQFINDIRTKFNGIKNIHDQLLEKGKISQPLIDDNFRNYSLFDGLSLKAYKRSGKGFNILDSYRKIETIDKNKLSLSYRDITKKILLPKSLYKKGQVEINTDAYDAPTTTAPIEVDLPNPSAIQVAEDLEVNLDDFNPNADQLPNDGSIKQYKITNAIEGFLSLSDEEFEKEISAMKSFLPNAFKFTPEGFTNLNVEGDVLGYVRGKMIHLNYGLKAKGVVYHEGFHAVFRNLLNERQQKYYLQRVAKILGGYKTDAKGKYIEVEGKKVYANEFREDRAYIHLNDEQIKHLIYEEYLADGFAKYMETNVVPKTWMQQLFAYLKRMLNMFTSKGIINNLYYDITAGRFKTAEVFEAKDNTQTVYSLYKGIPVLNIKDNQGGRDNQEVQSFTVNELKDKMVYLMAAAKAKNPDASIDDIYDIAKLDALNEYQIKNLVDQNPEKEQLINQKLGNHYSSARWLLGAFHDTAEPFEFINLTGNKKLDSVLIDKESNYGKEQLDVSKASSEKFKRDVITDFNAVDSFTDFDDILDSVRNEEIEDEENEVGESYSERTAIGLPPNDGTAAFRKLFKYVPYDYVDPVLGVTRKRMVSSNLIFSTIRKITCNTPKEKLVLKLRQEIDRLDREINHYNNVLVPKMGSLEFMPDDIGKTIMLRNSLKAIFDTLHEMTGLEDVTNDKGEVIEIAPSKNQHIYIQFANVMATVDIKLSMLMLDTLSEFSPEKESYEITEQLYRVNDIVIGKDINALRDDLVRRVRAINISESTFNEVFNVLTDLKTTFSDERTFRDRFLNKKTGMLNDAKFRNYVDTVYLAISKFNLNIPYSVIHIGLAHSIYKLADKTFDIFPKTGETYALLQANKIYFPELEKFTVKFFTNTLPSAVKYSLKANQKDKTVSTEELEKSLQRLATTYLNSVGEFVLKYDPTIAGSVTRNAAGDMISKYCKPTPAYTIIQELHEADDVVQGMKNIIQDHHLGLDFFFRDNLILNTENDVNRDFLANLKISAFAGFQQRITAGKNKTLSDAVTFKDIDDKAFALSMMGLYSDIEEVQLGKITYKKFKRILTVHEATSTSVVVEGLYQKYMNDDNTWTKDIKNRPLYMVNLLKGIEQEYNLMVHNFNELKNDPERQKYLGYNINPEKDRGFTFNLFADFFQTDVADSGEKGSDSYRTRVALRQELINQARNGVSFKDALSTLPELNQTLEKELKSFAGEQFQTFLNHIDRLGIKLEEIPTTGNPTSFLREMFFNTWINAIFVNQIFDGPLALGVKNTADYFKRQKTGAASGDNIYNPITKEKFYKAAVLPKIKFYLDNNDLTKPAQVTPHLDAEGKPLASNKEIDIFDGQSVNGISRIIKIAESQGKLTPEVHKLLRRMQYETVSSKEYSDNILALREAGIVFNSLKTVSASPVFYIKQSEHTLLRKDVSILKQQFRTREARIEAEKRLDALYQKATMYSWDLRNGSVNIDPVTKETYDYEKLYKETIAEIHSFFEPIKGREILHNMLNSMEFHDVDQLMDANATKKAIPEPPSTNFEEAGDEGYYFALNESKFNVSNKLTYLQLSTDKISKAVTQGIQQKLLLISQLNSDSEEFKHIKKEIDSYQKGLADAVLAQAEKLKRVLVGSDEEVIGKIFTKIADGLREQGASEDVLQYFELDDRGIPLWDPNLPVINDAIIYYYFSLFNKGVFDRKIDGRKYYHVSPFGYNVRENSSGRIITQDEYKSNPERYSNVKTRPLSFIKEEVTDPETGETINKYTVEVMIPKELRNVDQKFVEQYLSEFFATRIPTEDKRSMFVAKVVDYIDEAYGASIVVPFQVHMLSGSDFDIDALYVHIKSSYYLADGTRLPFGNYDYYKHKYGMSKEEAEFMEYLHYISKDDAIAHLVNAEVDKIKTQSGYKEEQAINFGMHFGGKIKNYFLAHAQLLNDPSLKDNIVEDFKRVIATFNVLRTLKGMGLPASPQDLKEYVETTGHSPVVDVIFNKILDDKMRILSDKAVFDKFLADTRNRAEAAAEPYKRLVERKGLSEKELYSKQNIYTPTSMLVARELTSEFKDCVGISASFNKGISMLATIAARLQNPIGYIYIGGEKVTIDHVIEAAVQLVGSSTGVFTDAPKEPFPAALNLNTITDPVMLTMYAFGFPQDAAIMFQSLPPVVKAIADYNKTFGSAYKSSALDREMSFPKFLNRIFNAQLKELEGELTTAGILRTTESGGKVVDKDSYKVIWTDKVEPGKTIESYGYEIRLADGRTPSLELQNFIILNEFRSYNQLASHISFDITRLTDPMKGLKPDFNVFDNIRRVYSNQGSEFFTGGTMTKLYKTYPVLAANKRALDLMNKKSKGIFIERTSFFNGLVSLFGSSNLYDKAEVIKNIKAYLGLQIQKSSMEKTPKGFFSQTYLDLLDPQNFLGPQLLKDFEYLRTNYPENEFVKQLVLRDEGSTVKGKRAKVLELVSSRLSKEQKAGVFRDFTALLSENSAVRQIAWKLGYYAMIKSGAQKSQGGYYHVLPAIFSEFINSGITEVRKDLVELDKLFSDITDVNSDAEKKYIDKLDEIINKNFNGAVLESVITDLIAKIVSINLANSPELERRKSTITLKKVSARISEDKVTREKVVNVVRSLTGSYAENIVKESGASVRLKGIPVKNRVDLDEIELFTPTGTKLKITVDTKMLSDEVELAVLRSAGITPAGEDTVSFPIYVKNIYGQMMVLKYIDGKTLGASFLQSMKEGDVNLTATGLTAQYEVAPIQGTIKISPLAFSPEQATQIKNMTSSSLQQISSERLRPIPDSLKYVPSSARVFELKAKNAYVTTDFLNKSFGLEDGTIVPISDKYFSFIFRNGKLWYASGERKMSPYAQSLDYLANALGEKSWESLTQNPKFEGFLKGQNKLFVYNLVKEEQPAPAPSEQQGSVNILSTDKIIWGHPTIGKSFLKKQGENNFITLDDDYANEVNAFVDANRGSETRQEYKGRKPKEYNQFMLNLFDRLKKQAQAEGKMLFVSNTNILKERMGEFDKVITMPKAEFKKRYDERGATYGFEDWKSDIDATVAKVPANKIINTTGYLSDLLPTQQESSVKPIAEETSPTLVASTIFELEPGISDEKLKTIYDNYAKLMGRKRAGAEMDFEKFKYTISKLQVYKYKDTYIFGNYDTKNAVFITRLNSSPTSKQLLAEALPNLVDKGLDFISFVPIDVAEKYERSGYTLSQNTFATEFRNEKMEKYAAASNRNVFIKVFGKSAENVTGEEIEKINDSTSIEYVPVQINADLIKLAGKELSNVLEVYLSQFGIVVKDIKEIKDQLNIDEVGFADIVSKIAYIKDRKDLGPVAGEFIAYMMQHNGLVKDIIKELSGVTDEEDYKELNKAKYLKMIGELITKDLQNKLKGEYSKSLLGKIKELITKFFELLNLVRIDMINQNVGIITNNIMQQNRKLITSSLYKPGAPGKPTKQVSLKAAMESDPFGKAIILKLSKRGFILTGSTSLGEQGDIQRPDENLLHDIDWVSPFNRKETNEKFLEEYPDAIFVREIVNDDYVTDTYLIAPEGHSIVNYNTVSDGDRTFVSSYDVADKNGKIVGTFRVVKGENGKAKEVATGVEGKVIDFFSYPTERNEDVYVVDGIKLSGWKPIFKAKTDWARYKDIWDYNRYIPNVNKPLITKRLKEIGAETEAEKSKKVTQDNKSLYRGQLNPFKLDKDGNLLLEPQFAGWQSEISYDKYKGMGISTSPELGIADAQGLMFYEGNVRKPIDEKWTDENEAEIWSEKAVEEGYYVVQLDKEYIKNNFKDIFDNGSYEQRIGTSKPIVIPKGKFKIQNFTPDIETDTEYEPSYDEIPGTTTFEKNAVYRALGYSTIPDKIDKLDNFENTIIEYVKHIETRPDGSQVAARNVKRGEKILVVLSQMRKKYKQKAWTKPANSEPLAKDAFKSFEEFMMFMYLHEKAHEYILEEEGETLKSYETRVNNEAMRRLVSEFRRTPEQIRKAKTLFSMYASSETGATSVERFEKWLADLKNISDKDIDDLLNDNTCSID